MIQLSTINTTNFKKVFIDITKYSLPLVLWGVFLWSQNMIGRWYIDIFLNKAEVANYSTMTSLALLPSTAIIAIVSQFIVPISYNREFENPGFISKINKKLMVLSIPIWIIVILLTYFTKDFLIKFLLDAKYLNVSWSLPYLMIGTAIYTIGQISIYEIYFYKYPMKLLISNIFPGLFTLIFGYYLIKHYGFKGAIITNVFSFFLYQK